MRRSPKLAVLFFVAFAIFGVAGLIFLQRSQHDVEAMLKEIAETVNQDVPRMIDAETDFLGVRAEGMEIIYLFRIHGITAKAMAASADEFRSAKLADIANNDDMRRLLKEGVTMSWEFFVGEELALRFSIDEGTTSGNS